MQQVKMKKKDYEDLLEPMELELNNVARWLQHTGKRIVVLFEGRDTAGKGGVISAIADGLNPRQVRTAALPKPTERERTQWYFQRYVGHLPAAGEMVLFDRSWYNRAGVEKVMGYCSEAEYTRFLSQAPVFERMLVDDGILLFKYWLSVDQQYQEERLNLIRNLLDRVPDCQLPEEPFDLPPLAHKPRKERFTTALKPLRNRF